MTDRIRASILNRMSESGIDSFLITNPSNIRYLTGYTGENAFAAVTGNDIVLFVYPLNREQAETSLRPPVTLAVIETSVFQHFGSLGPSFWGSTVGYEVDNMKCSTYRNIVEVMNGSALKPVSGIVENLRTVKTGGEVKSLERAQGITDLVFGEVLGVLREGVTELDIAAEIDYRFRRHGGTKPSFDTIVAFGSHSSMPHAIPDTRKLTSGDIVLFDMGTFLDGYASDMTRTVVFGHASQELRDRYRLVLEAQENGMRAYQAGNRCADAFEAAMAVFDAAGYRAQFIHSLGHGIGLEVHETPAVSPRSPEVFQNNAVVTVEPGLYFPGWGGIRIEDMAVVTEQGSRSLTRSPKTLIEV
jgi:Xaa-Pro aminopeptidase